MHGTNGKMYLKKTFVGILNFEHFRESVAFVMSTCWM